MVVENRKRYQAVLSLNPKSSQWTNSTC